MACGAPICWSKYTTLIPSIDRQAALISYLILLQLEKTFDNFRKDSSLLLAQIMVSVRMAEKVSYDIV